MTRVQLADTDLYVHPLQLGGNTFGWGADRDQSFAVLDAYAEAGGNFIDTADAYPAWVDGNSGGESETISGEGMKSRGNRDEMVIATKVGKHPGHPGVDPADVRHCVGDSLRRPRADHADLHYAPRGAYEVAQGAAAGASDALVRSGKVSCLGASNFSLERLPNARKISTNFCLACSRVGQDLFDLVSRAAVDAQKRAYLPSD